MAQCVDLQKKINCAFCCHDLYQFIICSKITVFWFLSLNKPAYVHTDAQPTDGERDTWNLVQAVLETSHALLHELQTYVGATEEIRLVSRWLLEDTRTYKAGMGISNNLG